MSIAQFRYNSDDRLWTLYWRRHTGKWYEYEGICPSAYIEDLIGEVSKDQLGIFWG